MKDIVIDEFKFVVFFFFELDDILKYFNKVVKWSKVGIVFDVFGVFFDVIVIGVNVWVFDLVCKVGNDVGMVLFGFSMVVGKFGR